jgi:hypothetical protein
MKEKKIFFFFILFCNKINSYFKFIKIIYLFKKKKLILLNYDNDYLSIYYLFAFFFLNIILKKKKIIYLYIYFISIN